MALNRIGNWSDAYENRAHIAGFDAALAASEARAAAFRERAGASARLGLAYGEDARQRLDLFLPEAAAKGLVIFIHGGYWRSLDRSVFSHLAGGPLARGWAVAMPSYRLAPAVPVAAITGDAAAAVEAAAAEVDGPIRLAGHSAGGHLACRMRCAGGPLSPETAARIALLMSISGVHDLRPLVQTDKNADLRLDAAQAAAESPALMTPLPGTRLIAWVGADERPEFVRQTELLANIWLGLGAAVDCVIEPAKHHFDVIDSLAEPEGDLTTALLET